jgi:hypothetical protein
MPATSEMQTISNSRDGSNSMTAHNSINASNSRSEGNNRMANTVGTPGKAWMLATAGREANYSRDNVNMRDYCSRRDNRNIMDVNSSKTGRTRQ